MRIFKIVASGLVSFTVVAVAFVNIFLARLCFRGIYFPMMGKIAWLKVVAQNRRTILKLARDAFFGRRTRPTNPDTKDVYEPVAVPDVTNEVSA